MLDRYDLIKGIAERLKGFDQDEQEDEESPD
jgi:hypothetical protein